MKKDDPSSRRSNRKISKRELEWLGHVLAGCSARDAGKRVGLTARQAKRTDLWIKTHREDSRKPYLWDIWREQLDKQLRILNAGTENIMRELCLIAFSSIDRFVELPRRTAPDGLTPEQLADWQPNENLRVKYIEDIPKELIPSIASIKETKDGIEVKLHSKMDALDKLARITKLFNNEPVEDTPFNGEINIHVKGTKSPLMLSIDAQQENKSKPTLGISK